MEPPEISVHEGDGEEGDEIVEQQRGYPSIEAYYKARAAAGGNSRDMPMNARHGMSNYSVLTLGDDRITTTRSVCQDMFRVSEEATRLNGDGMSEQRRQMMTKTAAQREQLYKEASHLVEEEELLRIEAMMREKLLQRTKGAAFVLRKTFKFFDRDGSGSIDIEEFKNALEAMGFQFTDTQVLALFGRYDTELEGELNYQQFVDALSESDFSTHHGLAVRDGTHAAGRVHTPPPSSRENGTAPESADASQCTGPDFIDDAEAQRVFRMLDVSGRGQICPEQLEVLLRALGVPVKQPGSEDDGRPGLTAAAVAHIERHVVTYGKPGVEKDPAGAHSSADPREGTIFEDIFLRWWRRHAASLPGVEL